MAMGSVEHVKELGQRSVPTNAVRARLGGGSPRLFVSQVRRSDAHAVEAAALKKLRSEFLPRVADTLPGDDETTLLEEWVDGLVLADCREPPPLAIALAVYLDVLSAIAALSASALVHGDVCPDNVLLGADGIGRLLQLGGGSVAGLRHNSRYVRFLAPEVLLADDAQDARLDLYAVSVLLWEAIERAPLFVEMHGSAILSRHLSGKLVAPRPKDAPWAAPLSPLVLRGLATDPSGRPATARAFADELRAAVRGQIATRAQVAEWVRNEAGTRLVERRAALGLPALPGTAARVAAPRAPAAPPTRSFAATAVALAPPVAKAAPVKIAAAPPPTEPAPTPATEVAASIAMPPPAPASGESTTQPRPGPASNWLTEEVDLDEDEPPVPTLPVHTPTMPRRGEPPLRPALEAHPSGEVPIDLVTDPDDRESAPPLASRTYSDRPTPLLGHEDLASLASATRHSLDRVTHPVSSSAIVPSEARPTSPLIAALPTPAPPGAPPGLSPPPPPVARAVQPIAAPPVLAPPVAVAVAPSAQSPFTPAPPALPAPESPTLPTPSGAVTALQAPRESDGGPIPSPLVAHDPPAEPRRRRAVFLVLGMVVVAAVFLIVALSTGKRKDSEHASPEVTSKSAAKAKETESTPTALTSAAPSEVETAKPVPTTKGSLGSSSASAPSSAPSASASSAPPKFVPGPPGDNKPKKPPPDTKYDPMGI